MRIAAARYKVIDPHWSIAHIVSISCHTPVAAISTPADFPKSTRGRLYYHLFGLLRTCADLAASHSRTAPPAAWRNRVHLVDLGDGE
mmetsp:Transcript_3754/g.7834  ORF Transcript_3754/g.7834 Transcript_3754/m.7834 type:complete len:87 (+) Transcript_3754:509-769(+)